MEWIQILVTLAAAFVIGYFFRRLKIPGGMMLGGIVGAALYNIFTGNAYMPFEARFFAQSMAGGFLGISLDRKDIKRFRRLAAPLAVVVGGMALSNILIGYLITIVSPLDDVTALAAGIAGGINDTPLIAEELGADAGKVALLQFVRLIAGIGLMPLIIRMADPTAGQKGRTERAPVAVKKKTYTPSQTLLTIAVALMGGYVGRVLGIPGGTLLFSVVTTAALRLSTGRGELVPKLKQVAQLLTGSYIGCMLNKQDVLELKYLFLPALVLVAVFSVNCFVSGFMIRKVSNFTIKESMLASIPAGASEMALLSSDLNIDQGFAADIMLLHILRVIAAVSIMPQLIPYIARLF